jgi:hypothetical protein
MTDAQRREAAGWPRLLRDAAGLRVRLRFDVRLHQFTIPAGAEGTIDVRSSGWRRIHFSAPACQCCGVMPYAYGLSWESYEIMKESANGDS